jgi:hypothetical protein
MVLQSEGGLLPSSSVTGLLLVRGHAGPCLQVRVAVVGGGTGEILQQGGCAVDYTSSKVRLATRVPGHQLYLPCATSVPGLMPQMACSVGNMFVGHLAELFQPCVFMGFPACYRLLVRPLVESCPRSQAATTRCVGAGNAWFQHQTTP